MTTAGVLLCLRSINRACQGKRSKNMKRIRIVGLGLLAMFVMSAMAAASASATSRTLSWGDNQGGQLGNDTTTGSHVPVAVSGLGMATVTAVSAGGDYSLA